jgi:hypothetical protein
MSASTLDREAWVMRRVLVMELPMQLEMAMGTQAGAAALEPLHQKKTLESEPETTRTKTWS